MKDLTSAEYLDYLLKFDKTNTTNKIIPVFLAPMSGITDFAFRNLVASFGSIITVCEMVADSSVVYGWGKYKKGIVNPTIKRLKNLDIKKNNEPYIVQLLGYNPDSIKIAANICYDLGADIVDLNFGCPAKKITKKACGSALMRDLDIAKKIIDAALSNGKVPVSVKMRLGWDSENMNGVEFAKMAEQAGVSYITVHGRTRKQKYQGNADWQMVAKIKQAVNIPVIVNGDIVDYDSANKALTLSNCDGLMIGRAARSNPWLPAQILEYLNKDIKSDNPSFNEQLTIIKRHYNEIISLYGEYMGVKIARKHLSSYLSNLQNSHKLRAKLMVMNDKQEILENLEKFYLNYNMAIN